MGTGGSRAQKRSSDPLKLERFTEAVSCQKVRPSERSVCTLMLHCLSRLLPHSTLLVPATVPFEGFSQSNHLLTILSLPIAFELNLIKIYIRNIDLLFCGILFL